MGRFEDLTGQKFGRLTVIERAENYKHGQARWQCCCDCGNSCIVRGYLLRKNVTRSCGCLSKEKNIARSVTHNMSKTKIYKAWTEMKRRCNNPSTKRYKDYGGRGIKVCNEWLDFQSFYDYVSKLEHFGEEGYTLDRINNDGNYEPNNVRWANKKEQARNTRRNVIVEYNGVEMTLSEAAEKSGVALRTLWRRFKCGDRDDRLFRPVKKRK